MAADQITHVLELERHIDAQVNDWKFQRIGWACMALLILLAIGGLFGGEGFFLNDRERIPGNPSLTLEYPRFARMQSPITVTLTPEGSWRGDLTLWIDAEYGEHLKIDAVTPPPDSVTGAEGGLLYRFSGHPGRVVLHVTPSLPGRLSWKAGTSGPGTARSFSQFIYP